MNENIMAAVIGASAAIIGVIIGQIITIINSLLQRRWNEYDYYRNRKVVTVEKRIDQIEKFVETMTKIIFKTKKDISFHATNSDKEMASERLIEWSGWKNEMDASNHYYSLAIRSLGDEILLKIYETLRSRSSEMESQLFELLNAKYIKKTKIDEDKYKINSEKLFDEYSSVMSDFFIRLDWIKTHITK